MKRDRTRALAAIAETLNEVADALDAARNEDAARLLVPMVRGVLRAAASEIIDECDALDV